jgi:hypothetical protein
MTLRRLFMDVPRALQLSERQFPREGMARWRT